MYDLEKLLKPIYEASLDPALWQGLIGDLQGAFHATGAALLKQDVVAGRYSLQFCGELDGASEAYASYYVRINPLEARSRSAKAGEVLLDRRTMAAPEFERTEYYNDFAKRLGVHSALALKLASTGKGSHLLVLMRRLGAGEFAREHVQGMERLAPHLCRAAAISGRIADLTVERDALAASFERLPQGVLLLDRSAHIVFANGSARAILAEQDGLRLERGALAATSAATTQRLRKLVGMVTTTGIGAPLEDRILVERDQRQPLRMLIVPFQHENGWEVLRSRAPAALVFVTDPERALPLAIERLVRLYGLTPTEATLAQAVAEGSGLLAAARALGIRHSTARTHLLRVFAKTGTRRQSEFVRLMLAGAAVV